MGFKMGRFERILSSLLVIVIMSTMVIDPLATAKAMSSKDSDKTALDYTIFSGSSSQDFNLSCWKSNIKGDVYTGRSFNYSGSELYLKGDIDARRKINTSGWIIKIDAQNIKAPFISMPDLDEVIHERAEQYEYYEGSKNFNQEKILVHNSIKVEDNINFNGSIFEGNCYVIAGGDIRYNVNTLNCQSDNTVVFYSENGDIVISGSDITINGILYAPKGKVQFNVNTLTLNGRIIADSVEFSGSQFNIYGAPEDLELITRPGISKIYTLDEDFLEGDLDGTSLSVPDQLVLAEREDYTSTGLESIYGDKGSNKGVKISSIIDKTVLNPSGDHFNITYNLSGFGDADVNPNEVDLVIVVDESGSMSGTRIRNAKIAAKEVITKMKPGDRCGIVGFNNYGYRVQDLTSDILKLNTAIDSLGRGGGTRIYTGLSEALSIFEEQSDDSRQKFIILLSDGEDSYMTQSIEQATLAGESDIRIFAMMIGTGTLQMQNIAIYSRGIYKNSPTAEEIGEIMSYFASEVFDTAGRNTTFRTIIKDKDMLDLSVIEPAPSSISENPDGSVVLEWYFDRISIDGNHMITLPFVFDGFSDDDDVTNFIDLIEDTSCVYYDRMGMPTVIYLDDISIPIGGYVEQGRWSVIYDSEREDIQWSSVYWNGKRWGDSELKVFVSASNDEENFGEAIPTANHAVLDDVVGRYVKLEVIMEASSDGNTPELYDITVRSDETQCPSYENIPPEINIVTKGRTKAGSPLNLRADITDDLLRDNIQIQWTSESEEIEFTEPNSLLSKVISWVPGTYPVSCTVSDGEHMVSVSTLITVEKSDIYDQIGAEDGIEAPAPDILVTIPEYADRQQIIDAHIENLNDTEIAWYSVILNGNQVIPVDNDGNFTITMPNRDGKYSVDIRAFDWSGKSDQKLYYITVDSVVPTVNVIASKDIVYIGEESPIFDIQITAANKLSSITYMLNDTEVVLDPNNQYVLDTSNTGEFTFTIRALTISGEILKASATIVVKELDLEGPILTVDLVEQAELGAKIILSILAEDESGIDRIEILLNGKPITFDGDSYEFLPEKAGEYTFLISAYDNNGNKSEIERTVLVCDTTPPKVEFSFDRDTYLEEDDLTVEIVLTDYSEIAVIEVKFDGEEVLLDENNMFTIYNLMAGEHVITVIVTDIAGNVAKETYITTVEEREIIDTTPPVLEFRLSKEKIIVGEPLELFIVASDDSGSVELSVVASKGIIGEEDGTYIFTATESGEHEITVTASDATGNYTTHTISFLVIDEDDGQEDQEEEREFLSLIVNNGLHETILNTEVTIKATAYDKEGIESLNVTVNETPISLDDNGEAVYIPMYIGIYTITATATNTLGYKESKTVQLEVYDPEDMSCPESKITGPEDGSSVTIPTEITGTVTEDGFIYYVLEYARVGDDVYTELAKGTEPVEDGVLGIFDTTLLANGWYTIRLTGYGSNYHTVDEIVLLVEGQMKVGNYSVSFRDIDIPVQSFPLTVLRNYDSRYKNRSGDFGYGWNLSMTGATLSESCVPGEYWIQKQTSGPLGLSKFYFDEERPHTVVIDWGNGKVDKFDMKLTPDSQPLVPIQYDISVSYTAHLGTSSKLEALGETTGLIYTDGLLYQSNLDVYHPKKYRLTTEDDTVYIINAKTGVESITDVNGNVITFDEDGVYHSDGKSIVFDRDDKGRISKITGPTGKQVSYQYNENGDLAYVTDILGETTKFIYNEEHYILEIIDPRGIKVARNEYDDEGRLIATIDAGGNRMEFDHDIDGSREVITDRLGNVTVYEYDDRGNIYSMTDALGRTTFYTYDSSGNLKTKTDALGNVTTYEYSANGKLLSVTDSYGNMINSNYNDKGQLISVSSMGIPQIIFSYDEYGREEELEDALGNKTYYSYDKKGRIKGVSDAIGDYMLFTYDGDGNIVSSTNGEGEIATYTYDADGRCISKTLTRKMASGMETLTENYTYDDAGRLLQIIYADGSVTSVEYNSIGLMSAAVDSKGRRTTYEYDLYGNLIKINYCDNTFETYEYDAEGRNTAFIDRMGRKVTMTYDAVGNLLSMTYPNGSNISYSYDAIDRLIEKKGVNGGVTRYEYDALSRNTAIIDAFGNHIEFGYNEYSQLSSIKDAKGNAYTYEYDANGNCTKSILPDGTYIATTYDARGRITNQTDQNGYKTTYNYDRADRLTSVTDALDNTWSYTYNSVGELVIITDANGDPTYYTYDELGRVTCIENALGNVVELTYDKAGNILTLTDYAGITTTYQYDELDRLIKEEADEETICYTYTVDGMLSSVIDKNGTTEYTYDIMNGLTDIIYPDGSIIHYEYDEACRLTKVETPYGSTLYSYDILDRLVRVVGHDGLATVYEYDENGNRSAVRYANGMVMTYEYDSVNRLIKEETIDKDTGLIASYAYRLGPAGERLKVEETDRIVEYEYDALYRLCKEVITEGDMITTISYTYDAVGNRLTKTENGQLTTYLYNELNQLVSENDIIYTYDENGNLISQEGSGQKANYTYDVFNRLIRATVQSGQDVVIEEYRYDWAGNRIAKITGAGETKYLVDTNGLISQVLAETDESGNLMTFYTRGEELISLHRADETYYYLYDGHGSVRMLANEEGTITDTYTYDAFGNLINRTGDTRNDFLFYGEQYDANTGFYYLRARYMNPSTGTFITMDAYQGSIFDPVSLHKYLYADANPIMNSDPTGYFTLSEMNVSMGIQGILANIAQPNIKFALNILDFMITVVDTSVQISRMLQGGKSAEEIFSALSRGAISGLFLNKMCMIKGIGPTLSKIVITFGFINQYKSIEQAFQEGDTALGTLRTLQIMIMGSSLYESCFTGETLVSVEDGQKRIDEVQVGDYVWAYNIESEELELKKVTRVYEKETTKLLHLYTSTGIIDTTSNHPFYVIGKGWVAAGDIEIGDEIYTLDGSITIVLKWEYEQLSESITVYNLEVEDFNSYFVGSRGVLVHNYKGTEGGSQADVLAKNRSQGKVFEQQEFSNFSSNNTSAAEQITIKTSSGTKTRVDAIGLDANGNVVINEFKSSATAPLTPNQRIAFPELYSGGGTVVGKGKGIFTGGYQIPSGTEVKIIRPQIK